MDETQAQNSSSNECSEKEICDLLIHFSHNTYSAVIPTCEPRPYMSDVIKLLEKDYILAKIDNKNGALCPQYPSTIPVMESVRSVTTIYENEDEIEAETLDMKKVEDLIIEGANLGRCRQRFPVPVILFNGKFICRSSTLAGEPEICYRTGLINVPGYELLNSVKEFWWPCEGLGPVPEVHEEAPEGPGPLDNDARTQTICDKVRNLDIKLLRSFNVDTIVDIMVEKRKVKHSLYVSASEKVDQLRYASFKLIGLPYPGCEFFKEYHDAMYNAEGLKFKWDQPANDAELSVPNDNVLEKLQVAWQQYKEWDLILLTQNYIKYILKRLQEDNTGLSLHCISGWDRTPLFISLIRLSLWADYLVHPSLNEYEILYLTLAYDWYLFGHHLSNRLFKNEEIMAFCFDFLRYMVGDEFSAKNAKKKYSDESSCKTDDSSPSRSQSSGASDENPIKKKKRQHVTVSPDFLVVEVTENSNDSSTTVPMDIVFEDSNSPPYEDCMDTGDKSGNNGNLQSPIQNRRRTSPIMVGSRRQRSESTGSTTSNLSANWQMITESGSVERDHHFKPQRLQRLEKVRSLFNTCYQKTIKNESFGPPKKWMIEEIVGSFSQWWDFFPESHRNDVGNNGNIEKPHLVEPNGNGARRDAAQEAETDEEALNSKISHGDDKMKKDQNGDDEVMNNE